MLEAIHILNHSETLSLLYCCIINFIIMGPTVHFCTEHLFDRGGNKAKLRLECQGVGFVP